MTKQEYRAKQKELDAVVDALPEDVAMAEARVEEHAVAPYIHARVDLWSGIQEAAQALGVSQVERRAFKDGGGKLYFTVGGVTVVQYWEEAEI